MAIVLALLTAGCGDDGPVGLRADDTWSVPREQRQAEFTLAPWTADEYVATDMVFLPDGHALVLTKGGWDGPGTGQILILGADGQSTRTLLDIPVCTDAERGLLGIALDADFANNNRLFVYYTKGTADCAVYTEDPPAGSARVENRVSAFTYNVNAIDPASEVVYLDGLTAGQSSHNAGGLDVMPDGTLLVGVGEAGTRASRDLDVPYGKILRLDPAQPGAGAADNPFFDPAAPTAVRSLVYASGLRNPFRLAVEPVSGRVAVTDVGTDVYEEVNVVEPGADYGFPDVEGPDRADGATPPALWYTHEDGCNSIIGATWVPEDWLAPGKAPGFVFTDFGCGGVFVADVEGLAISRVATIAPTIGYSLASVVLGPDAALYLVGVGPGPFPIQRLARSAP